MKEQSEKIKNISTSVRVPTSVYKQITKIANKEDKSINKVFNSVLLKGLKDG